MPDVFRGVVTTVLLPSFVGTSEEKTKCQLNLPGAVRVVGVCRRDDSIRRLVNEAGCGCRARRTLCGGKGVALRRQAGDVLMLDQIEGFSNELQVVFFCERKSFSARVSITSVFG